ncbi:MAG: hypothetical protein GC159_12335 [Phycisphaera sp.]|nr:hypothetical protein [Phycisphaera sp.]
MKAMFFLIVILALGLGAVYMFGMSDFDPEQQGQEALKSIHEGQTWLEVCNNTQPPKKFRTYVQSGDELKPTGDQRFPGVDQFGNMMSKGQIKNGFIFQYYYTDKVAFYVHFNAEGKVEMVSNMTTQADLLHTR